MSFLDKIAGICPCEHKKEVNVGKIVFKTVAITATMLAFVPTVFVKREGGFDAYALLSRIGYRKSTDGEGKTHHNVVVSLIDLSRYGIGNKNETAEEENENSISIKE